MEEEFLNRQTAVPNPYCVQAENQKSQRGRLLISECPWPFCKESVRNKKDKSDQKIKRRV